MRSCLPNILRLLHHDTHKHQGTEENFKTSVARARLALMFFARDARFWLIIFSAWIISFSASAAFWATNAPVNTPRYSHTATLLTDGRVLVAGGYNGSYLATTEIYDPFTGTFAAGPNMTTNRSSHTATLLPNGKVLVVGGSLQSGFFQTTLGTTELFDPLSGTWTPTGTLNNPRSGHTATLLPNGKVLVTGGSVYDINTFTTTNMPSAESMILRLAFGRWLIRCLRREGRIPQPSCAVGRCWRQADMPRTTRSPARSFLTRQRAPGVLQGRCPAREAHIRPCCCRTERCWLQAAQMAIRSLPSRCTIRRQTRGPRQIRWPSGVKILP